MNTTQRYRHIPVLAPEPGDGVWKYRRKDRAALVKKALATTYGDGVVHDPAGNAAIMLSDMWAFLDELALSRDEIIRVANDTRRHHDRLAAREASAEEVILGE